MQRQSLTFLVISLMWVFGATTFAAYGSICTITNEAAPISDIYINTDSNLFMTVTWESCSDHLYQVLSSDELSTQATATVQVTLIGQDGTTSWTDTNAPSSFGRFYQVLRLTFNGDDDGDGIPNLWEVMHGLDLNDPSDGNRPSNNPWAHGLTNLQVYHNPSVLLADNYSTLGDGIPDWWRIKYGDAMMTGDACTITNEAISISNILIGLDTNLFTTVAWQSCSDHLYQVQMTSQLSTQTVWTEQATLVGQDGTTSWTDTNAPSSFGRFYQVLRLTFNGDDDGDGIPNLWEVMHGLDLNDPSDGNQPSSNPRAHGLTNLQVYHNPSVLLADNYSTLGDGIPDWWRIKYGDAMMTGDACITTSGESSISNILIGVDTNLFTTVAWQSCSNHVYDVQATDQLSTQTVWTVRAGLIGQDGTTSWTDILAPSFSERFYQVVRLPFNGDYASQPSSNPWAHGLTNLQVYHNPSVLLADNYSTLGDGIPDWWRIKYGDAMMTGDACTITNEASSISNVLVGVDTNLFTSVAWQSCSDHFYQVQATSQLSTQTVWAEQATLVGQDGTTSWTDTNAPSSFGRFYQVLRLTFNGNQNGDGIPNWWKVKYGFFLTDPNVASGDPDGDGFTNLQEYLYGMNPLHHDSIAVVNGGVYPAVNRTIQISPSQTTIPFMLVSLDPTMAGAITYDATNGAFVFTLPESSDQVNYDIYVRYADSETNAVGSVLHVAIMVDLPELVVSNHVLVVWNTNSAISASLKDYYLANRPGFSNVNLLAIGCSTSEQISLSQECIPQIENPVVNWLTNNPNKLIRYMVLVGDIPTRVDACTDALNCTNAVDHELSYALAHQGIRNGSRFDGSITNDCCRFTVAGYPGMTALITRLWMGSEQATRAYVDKIAAKYTGDVIISAGYTNCTYYVDDTRTSEYGAVGPARVQAILSENPSANIVYQDGNPISSGTNVCGYLGWGVHSGWLSAGYATNGAITFIGTSDWFLIQTVESFNGRVSGGQGSFVMWFSEAAFGGTDYEHTPVAAVGHCEEPGPSGVNNPNLFRMWERGWPFAEAAWISRLALGTVAFGDPLVRK